MFYNGIYIHGQDKNGRIGTSSTLMEYPKEPQGFYDLPDRETRQIAWEKDKEKIPIQNIGIQITY